MNPIYTWHNKKKFGPPLKVPNAAMTPASALIWTLHLVLVGFMALAPFSSNPAILVAHLVATPFLWLHWLLNNDACALTLLEQQLRGGVPARQTFMHALVSPVYKVSDADVRSVAWLASGLLWLVTLARVRWSDVSRAFGVTT